MTHALELCLTLSRSSNRIKTVWHLPKTGNEGNCTFTIYLCRVRARTAHEQCRPYGPDVAKHDAGDSLCAVCQTKNNSISAETEKPTLISCTILIHLPHENIACSGTHSLAIRMCTHYYYYYYHLLCTTFAFRQISRVLGNLYIGCALSTRNKHTHTYSHSYGERRHTHTNSRKRKPKDWARLRSRPTKSERKKITHKHKSATTAPATVELLLRVATELHECKMCARVRTMKIVQNFEMFLVRLSVCLSICLPSS